MLNTANKAHQKISSIQNGISQVQGVNSMLTGYDEIELESYLDDEE
jgi:hypothetical protein